MYNVIFWRWTGGRSSGLARSLWVGGGGQRSIQAQGHHHFDRHRIDAALCEKVTSQFSCFLGSTGNGPEQNTLQLFEKIIFSFI